jgi:copper homeostasis protein
MKFKLEVIGFTLDGCQRAQKAGANRIELCDNQAEGGTTPSYGFIEAARATLSIALYPIIRPRGGDFLYTEEEFGMMKSDVKICKSIGCDGVVFGMLNRDGTLDKKRCGQLVELAYPMGVTFHRAFDRVNDASRALEDLIDIGCERILTSGLVPHALDGATTISRLISEAGDRIIIMPGSGIRSGNIGEIADKTGATEFHSSARVFTASSMGFNNPQMMEHLQSVTVDEDEIRKMIQTLTAKP